MTEKKEKMLFARITEEKYKKLQKVAEDEYRTVSAVVRIAVDEYLKKRA